MNFLCGWETQKQNQATDKMCCSQLLDRTETWINKKEAASITFSFVVPLCCLVTWCLSLWSQNYFESLWTKNGKINFVELPHMYV